MKMMFHKKFIIIKQLQKFIIIRKLWKTLKRLGSLTSDFLKKLFRLADTVSFVTYECSFGI